jgi:anhydro-N-acetylmuramic acid kinase
MKYTVIGMISGTSFDGIDAAVADLELVDDEVLLRPRGLYSADIPSGLRARIAAILPPNETTIDEVCRLDTELGQLFGRIAARANDRLAGGSADLIVSHGQTVYHWVEGASARGTLQLGAAAWIAEATGVTTVSDLRSRDITRGGHGAPLASTLDALLLLDDDSVRRGSLNLGGIANITVRDASGQVIAYDLGPANALLDAAVAELSGGSESMDSHGARAAHGRVDEAALARLLAEPYYRLPPPKSTGKELFTGSYVRERLGALPADDDLLATLTELAARLVAEACHEHKLDELVVAGGGVRNPTLMRRIAQLCAPVDIRLIDAFGLPAQAKEGYLFALLGYLSVHGLPGTIASATGASEPALLGSVTPGRRPLALPEPVAQVPRRLRVV